MRLKVTNKISTPCNQPHNFWSVFILSTLEALTKRKDGQQAAPVIELRVPNSQKKYNRILQPVHLYVSMDKLQ